MIWAKKVKKASKVQKGYTGQRIKVSNDENMNHKKHWKLQIPKIWKIGKKFYKLT